ncbi:hypothetical protein ACJ41O_003912 [Fusarium nematophilum]
MSAHNGNVGYQSNGAAPQRCDTCHQDPPAWYCVKCDVICVECWDSHKPHLRGDHRHARIEYEQYIRYYNVFRRAPSQDTHGANSEGYERCLWFEIDRRSDSGLVLADYPRFEQLVGEHRDGFLVQRPIYPRLTTFTGNTGAGKSAIIRLLIEQPWSPGVGADLDVPVVGQGGGTIPTSGDVHLYRDPKPDEADFDCPVFFADCEGFQGGNQQPRARVRARECVEDLQRRVTNRRHLSSFVRRDEAVGTLFPRLLYNFSEVVVHVVLSAAARQMETELERLLKHALMSRTAVVNCTALPHLIVVLNQSDAGSEWDPSQTTTRIYEEHHRILEQSQPLRQLKNRLEGLGAQINSLDDLLKQCYASVEFIRLPTIDQCPQLAAQLERLSAMIKLRSRQVQLQKRSQRMLLSSRPLNEFFKLAFSHFSNRPNQPFDFLEQLFSHHLLSGTTANTLSDNLLELMRAALLAMPKGAGVKDRVRLFVRSVAPVVCSVIALDAIRRFQCLPGPFQNIFRGSGSPSESCGPPKISYQSQVQNAFHDLALRFISCEYVDSVGRRCVNRLMAHQESNLHQASSGDSIGFGRFESRFHNDLATQWDIGLDTHIKRFQYVLQKQGEQVTDEGFIWKRHQEHLANLFQNLPGTDLDNGFVCFWCFHSVPAEILPCGHGICNSCLACAGAKSTDPTLDSRVAVLPGCSLHSPERRFQHPVMVLRLPGYLGRRLLSLDGGGTRAIVELHILSAVEHKFGGHMPLSKFFDLIGGTSAGGLIAIGLGLRQWTLPDAIRLFTQLSKKAFTKHNIPESERTVTQYGFEATDSWGRKLRVWEAARATSAAPSYFPPFKDPAGTEYWDGGLYFNNPAGVVASEADRIWPLTKGRPTDLLLSVGNGWTTERNISESSGILRSKLGRRWDLLQVWGVLRGRLVQNMNSEDMWTERFGNSANRHPTRYIRLNPGVQVQLPKLDNIQALEQGGLLGTISGRYLQERDTQLRIDIVYRRLISTSFYLQVSSIGTKEWHPDF